MRNFLAVGILSCGLTCIGPVCLLAQDLVPDSRYQNLLPDGKTVYDTVHHLIWLRDANLAATNTFGLPLCDGSGIDPCVNASGSMDYASAMAWIAAMNAYGSNGYLGHHDWQLPVTPAKDPTCAKIGANGDRFGFDCQQNALGYLYYKALKLSAPETAVPMPDNTVGPFNNFQPYFYWSQSGGGGLPADIAVFSFNSGSQGGATMGNFMYVLPMIAGEMLGVPTPSGNDLHVNPGGETVYDPGTNDTWLADANLAASKTFGLPRCDGPIDPEICIAKDGSMSWETANQFIAAMNAFDHGVGYLGQTNWQLPPVEASCPTFGCAGTRNPMGNLYYTQLNFGVGEPVVPTPSIAVGPFHHVQPYLYWSCQGTKIENACTVFDPPLTAQWGFSFGNGFLGTERLEAEYYVTAYAPGCDPHDPGQCIKAP